MSVPPRLTGLLVALLLAAGGGAPATALAQSAGDEQYQDPLAGEEPPSTGAQEPPSTSGGEPTPPGAGPEPAPPASGPDTSTSSDDGGSAGAGADPPPGAEPAPLPATAETGAGTAPSAREAGELPRTGDDPLLSGLLGAALLAAGAALRVRGRAADGPG